MKQMIYTKENKKEILFNGEYKGYNFYIISYGIHPCAYVELDKKIIYQDLEDEISCHGGLTYSGDLGHVLGEQNGRWFVGWDYAHCGDYEGYYDSPDFKVFENEKKWTTEEIYEEVKNVVDQLIKLEGTK